MGFHGDSRYSNGAKPAGVRIEPEDAAKLQTMEAIARGPQGGEAGLMVYLHDIEVSLPETVRFERNNWRG